MSNSGMKPTAEDEVEQLLRAAEDDMLLKLSLNSHMARASSSSAAVPPDLDRRFQALKKPTKIDDSTITKTDTGNNKDDGAAADDDLLARFAKLKNSHPSHKSHIPSDESIDQKVEEEENDEDDEVDKIIKWAIDAARLDPSPSSDEDEDDVDLEDDIEKKGKRR